VSVAFDHAVREVHGGGLPSQSATVIAPPPATGTSSGVVPDGSIAGELLPDDGFTVLYDQALERELVMVLEVGFAIRGRSVRTAHCGSFLADRGRNIVVLRCTSTAPPHGVNGT